MEILKIKLEEQLLIRYYVIKAFTVAKNPKYDGYQCELALVVYKCFDKETSGGTVKNDFFF